MGAQPAQIGGAKDCSKYDATTLAHYFCIEIEQKFEQKNTKNGETVGLIRPTKLVMFAVTRPTLVFYPDPNIYGPCRSTKYWILLCFIHINMFY